MSIKTGPENNNFILLCSPFREKYVTVFYQCNIRVSTIDVGCLFQIQNLRLAVFKFNSI